MRYFWSIFFMLLGVAHLVFPNQIADHYAKALKSTEYDRSRLAITVPATGAFLIVIAIGLLISR